MKLAMHASSFLTPLLVAAGALAQAVPEGIAPDSNPPEGCEMTKEGEFTIGSLGGFDGRDGMVMAQQAMDGYLTCTLNNGILHDQDGRTGSIVANHQFQFDGPPQAGAIYTGGFSICGNGSLAIGGTTRWWQCSSGSFYNLYDQWIGDQCEEIRIQVKYEESSDSSASTVPGNTASPATTGTKTACDSANDYSCSQDSTSTSGVTSTRPSHTITTSMSSFPTRSGNLFPVATENHDAPPANIGAGGTLHMRTGTTLGAVMAIVGATLIL